MKTVILKQLTATNTLDSQLKALTGLGFSSSWVWVSESSLYCQELDTTAVIKGECK